jgi:hypothetical protein
MPLGRDFSADAMAAFGGLLYSATLSRPPVSAYSTSDPTGGPTGSPTTYSCEGIAFTYQQRDIDGSRVVKGDYRVVILRGSLAVTPAPGDSISIPPPGSTVAATARVINLEAATEAAFTVQVRG